MAKKKTAASTAKAAKKAKAAQKVEKKVTKKGKKSRDDDGGESDGEDLEGILEKMRQEWEAAHIVTEELADGPPSRRANATLTACPTGNYLWCIGGEFFSEDGRAYFYNDVYRYSPDKDEWRRFVCPTCPGPRSAHAVAATPSGGGKIFLFGGEFSSLHQTTFHHYRDFWVFDVSTHAWDRIDTKIRPSARSGHRMAVWKHWIVLFGGFYDPGVTTRYLNDLWIFDTQEYKWRQVEFRETDLKPSPRSGFSFLPCAEGIILHGGYCKEYVKGKRPVGVMLDDTWLLKLSLPTDEDTTTTAPSKSKPNLSKAKSSSTSTAASSKPHPPTRPIPTSTTPALNLKWQRLKRPSDAYAPSLRSGCTMSLWPSKSMGILFGGVTDEDTGEEGMDSVFWNDLYGYQLSGKGKWVGLALKKPKVKGAKGRGKAKAKRSVGSKDKWSDDDNDGNEEGEEKEKEVQVIPPGVGESGDGDDPMMSVPLPRYNAMLAVLRNTLYIYGGIYERGSREYTLDDFYALQLDKMERYVCLKRSDVVIEDVESSSSDDDDEEDGEDDSSDEDDDDGEDGGDGVGVGVEEEKNDEEEETSEEHGEEAVTIDGEVIEEEKIDSDLRNQANTFMGVSKDSTRSPEDVLSTPLPGETLAMFYARSREYWSQKAFESMKSDSRGKQLRRDGFVMAEERYGEYKPLLKEVEKILAEAGLDEEEMRRGAAAGASTAGGAGQSRNRR